MKTLKNLGKRLSKTEQKSINSGRYTVSDEVTPHCTGEVISANEYIALVLEPKNFFHAGSAYEITGGNYCIPS